MKLADFIRAEGLDHAKVMDWLQGAGLVSDLAVMPKDVADCDADRAIEAMLEVIDQHATHSYYIHPESSCAYVDQKGRAGQYDGMSEAIGPVGRQGASQQEFERRCRQAGVREPFLKL